MPFRSESAQQMVWFARFELKCRTARLRTNRRQVSCRHSEKDAWVLVFVTYKLQIDQLTSHSHCVRKFYCENSQTNSFAKLEQNSCKTPKKEHETLKL